MVAPAPGETCGAERCFLVMNIYCSCKTRTSLGFGLRAMGLVGAPSPEPKALSRLPSSETACS